MSVPIRKALYGKLAADTTLTGLLSTDKPPGRNQNIFHSFAPDGGGTPYVIFSKSAGTPTYTFEPRHRHRHLAARQRSYPKPPTTTSSGWSRASPTTVPRSPPRTR